MLRRWALEDARVQEAAFRHNLQVLCVAAWVVVGLNVLHVLVFALMPFDGDPVRSAWAQRLFPLPTPTEPSRRKQKHLAQQAGFTYAVATDTGGLHLEDDRMQIFRINMFPHETPNSLFKKTASWYRNYYRWKRGK